MDLDVSEKNSELFPLLAVLPGKIYDLFELRLAHV